MIDLTATGIEASSSRITKIGQLARQNMVLATIASTQLIAADVRARFFPATRISAQDSPDPGRIQQGGVYEVAYSEDGLTGNVHLGSHVSKVTRALVDVLARTGQSARIQHTGLWINLQRFIRGARGRFAGRLKSAYDSRQGLSFLPFASHNTGRERLGDWAQLTDKGLQARAKSVRVGQAELEITTGHPAIEKNREKINALYREALTAAVDGA